MEQEEAVAVVVSVDKCALLQLVALAVQAPRPCKEASWKAKARAVYFGLNLKPHFAVS